MDAIQSGSNAAGRRAREVNVGLDSPARRTRQRLAQLDAESTGNAYMRSLFGAQTGDSDADIDPNDEDEEPYEDEQDEMVAEVPAAEVPVVEVPPAVGGRQVMVGREEIQYGTNRLTNLGRDWLLEKCVKENVFPKIKFATLNGDLDFSNNPNSICRFMAEKMKVQDEDVEGWWENSKKAVHNKLKANRNNVIKALKIRFHGKNGLKDYVVVPCFL